MTRQTPSLTYWKLNGVSLRAGMSGLPIAKSPEARWSSSVASKSQHATASGAGVRRNTCSTGFMFIVNPNARGGRTRQQLDELRKELELHNIFYDVRLPENLDHASILAREANLAGYHTIVAVGGDGTINRVLNGFFTPDGSRLSRARLGVIHIGTSPDFCRSYGVPRELSRAVAALASGVSKPIPVGHVSFATQDSAGLSNIQKTAVFACCANAGFGASLARLANGGIRKRFGDFAGTFLCLLRVLRHFCPVTVHLEVDGQVRQLSRVYNLAVGRSRFVASGLQVRHQLQSTDSLLYLVCLRNISWRNLIPAVWSLYSGRPIKNSPYLSMEYAHSVAMRSVGQTVELEFDGDPAGWCPAEFRVAPEPIDLLIPACL
jgi:diacylglycerol kinase family enzyme